MLTDLKQITNAIWQSVVSPNQFLANTKSKSIIIKYGWIFILLRWSYYSFTFFLFRDYQGSWKPFSPIPFGLNIGTYAFLQIRFSVFFGIFLMFSIAFFLWTYLRYKKITISLFEIFNILGITFFLPFLIVQPLDLFIINIFGWVMFIIIPLHTLILLWEAVVSMIIIHHI